MGAILFTSMTKRGQEDSDYTREENKTKIEKNPYIHRLGSTLKSARVQPLISASRLNV